MKLSNIRPNFTEMDEVSKRNFFLTYYDKRANDFSQSHLKTVKIKSKGSSTSSKEPKLKVTDEQLALLKLLNLV